MEKKKKLTIKQKRVLDFVAKQVKEKGYPPSIREICEEIGVSSTSTAHAYLEKLHKLGYLERENSKTRAIKIVDSVYNAEYKEKDKPSIQYPYSETIDVPVVGKVTAGMPILAVENHTDTFSLPTDLVGNTVSFMLKVKGESMIEAGILDGDFILVRQQNTANNGDIVVALIEDEATVKAFYKEKDYIRLQPRNSSMDPIIVKDVVILGKVVGVFRKL